MSERFARASVLWLALALLPGCSGGGTAGNPKPQVPVNPGDGGDTPEAPEPSEPAVESYALRRAELTATRSRLVADTFERRTSSSALPATGQAVYEGQLAAGLSGAGLSGTRLVGDVSLVASFGTGTLAGRIDDFRRADETPVRGSLEIRRTELQRGAAPHFEGDLQGTLTDGIGAIGVEGTARGSFYGAGAEYLAGDVSGTVTTGSGRGTMSGAFVTE